MMKKFTSLAAALLFAVSLAACGSAESVPTAASVSQSTAASSAVPESESTAESESSSESTSSSTQSTAESAAESASTSASETTSATAVDANGVTGIELSSTGGLLYVGYSASAKVYTTPYEAPAANAAEVKYTSSDESVVTVTPNTSGAAGFMVQGVAPGTATVTVEYQGCTAEYNVTVQKYVAPAQTSTNKTSGTYKGGSANAGASTPAAQAPAQTAPVTQAPAATTPTPAPTPAPAPTTPPAESQPNIVYGPNENGTPIGDNDLIGGNGFDWGAVEAGGEGVGVKE